MAALSRQDVQNMLDTFRSRLVDQLGSRQDMQKMSDTSRDRIISYMHDFLLQNQQQFVRQLDIRTKLYKDRLSAMESRILSLEQELKASRQLMEQMSHRQRNVVIPQVQEVANRDTRPQPSEKQQYRYDYTTASWQLAD